MKIADIRAETVTVQMEAALRHANRKQPGGYACNQDSARSGGTPVLLKYRSADPAAL